jgi:hypothetical protein
MSYDSYKPILTQREFDFEETEKKLREQEDKLRRAELSAPATLVPEIEVVKPQQASQMETRESNIPHVNLSRSKVVTPSPVKGELKVQKAVIYRDNNSDSESDSDEEIPQNKVQTRGEFLRARNEELKKKQKDDTNSNLWTIGIILVGAALGFYAAKKFGETKKEENPSNSNEPKLFI